MKKKNYSSIPDTLAPIQEQFLSDVGQFSYTFDPTYAALRIAEALLELVEQGKIKNHIYKVNEEFLKLIDIRFDVIEQLCLRATIEKHIGGGLTPPNISQFDEIEMVTLEAKARLIAPLVAVAVVAIQREDFHWLDLALNKIVEASLLKTLRDARLLPMSEEEAIDVILKELRAHAKELLDAPIGERGGSKPDYDLTHLGSHFESVYPLWQEAKRLYRQAQKTKEKTRREKWRESIKIIYTDLPDDLIERLAKVPTLSEEINIKLQQKGGSSASADIAAEHAARLCGAPAYHYSIRYLKGLLSKQGVSAKKVKSKQSV